MSNEQQLALVTGASRGIGKAIALRLVNDGFLVIGTATSTAGAEAIEAFLNESSEGHRGMALNVNQPDAIEQLINNTKQEFGKTPEVLVNNAGITRDNLLMRMKDDEWDSIISTNLTAIYKLSKACMRGMMKARHGRIISIGSVVGTTGNPGQANYAAAKAGVIGFSKSLAKEVGSRGITVNVVAPGFIDTDMTQALDDAQRQTLQQQIALGRLGQADDIAAAVAFLASDQASYITGETLHVNGGMNMA